MNESEKTTDLGLLGQLIVAVVAGFIVAKMTEQ